MNQTLPLALYGASAGAAAVAALALYFRWQEAFAYRAGVALFVLLALVSIGNVYAVSAEHPSAWAVQLQGLLSAALFPTAWLYTRDLAADVPRPFVWTDVWHYAVPAVFVPQVIWAALSFSPQVEAQLAASTELPIDAQVFVWTSVILVLLWIVQVSFYSTLIARTLIALPRRLRLVFADLSGRSLAWLRIVLFLFLAHLPLAIVHNLGLIQVPEIVFASISFVLTCGWAAWTTSQQPAFQVTTESPNRISVDAVEDSTTEKYAKSLLDAERMARITAKIEAAFKSEKLHLNPNLSLSKLAAQIGVSESNLSQTFSRQMNSSFYDYVNACRAAEAMDLLATTDTSVVEIGVAAGFNTRSAFYNAFKATTGTTPAAFRRQHRPDA